MNSYESVLAVGTIYKIYLFQHKMLTDVDSTIACYLSIKIKYYIC
jgi:hypothetical protein